MRTFVVLNPAAGRCDPEEVRRILAHYFDNAEGELEVYETVGGDRMSEVVQGALARGFEIVYAAGGDGTVSEVVDGLVGTDVPLGIIPVGTTNAFAQEVGIPQDVEEACRLLSDRPSLKAIDAVQVGHQYFILNVGVGLGAVTMEKTGREAKRRFGQAAYVWTVLNELVGLQPRRFTVEVDGERQRTVRAADILLANSGVLTTPLRWGPQIHPDDGQIDVCIIRARTIVDYAILMWHTLLRRQRSDPNIRYLVARKSVKVDAEQSLPIAGDGEVLGRTPLDARVVPRAVQVFVPRDADGR